MASVEPKAKPTASTHLNIEWVQHIDVLHITQDEIASGAKTTLEANSGESPLHTRVNRVWRRTQEEEHPVPGWSLALALCPKDGDGVGIRAHYRPARRVGDATTGEGQNIL